MNKHFKNAQVQTITFGQLFIQKVGETAQTLLSEEDDNSDFGAGFLCE